MSNVTDQSQKKRDLIDKINEMLRNKLEDDIGSLKNSISSSFEFSRCFLQHCFT